MDRSSLGGAYIGLRVLVPRAWPERAGWQDVWTAVQWQDRLGHWHEVRGWQGTLEDAVRRVGGGLTGHKVWWVDPADMGRGPFRWCVREGRDRDGALLGVSERFYLPREAGQMQWVEVTLP